MPSEASTNSDSGAPRAARRLKVFLPAMLTRGGVDLRVHLLDISSTGALLHATMAIPANEQIVLRWEGLTWSGTVMWSAGNRFGIAFAREIAEEQIAQVLGAK